MNQDRRRRQLNVSLDLGGLCALIAIVILALHFFEQFFAWLFA